MWTYGAVIWVWSQESHLTNHAEITSGAAGDDTEQSASAMRGMHPATSAISNLYGENVTLTNDDGLWVIYGAEPESPALFQPPRDDPHPWRRYLYILALRSCGYNRNSKKWVGIWSNMHDVSCVLFSMMWAQIKCCSPSLYWAGGRNPRWIS